MPNNPRAKFANDPQRPIYHFLPPENWMNDPNGLIQWKGKYHLFYQHNPYQAVWGNMHWGHAVSDDLLHWRDMPIAIAPTPDSPDEQGVFSGCAVDNDGVATVLYTGAAGEHNEIQTVCIATSTDDDLQTWEKYSQNPIISAAPEEFAGCGFRDPYVWREEDGWYMVIGAGEKGGGEAVLLYHSADLYEWEYLHPLLVSDAKNEFVYECPNFFPFGDKWVLLVSVMPESHVKYYVGTYKNRQFSVEHQSVLVNGPFYAALVFRDDSGRRIMMGWIQEQRPVAHLQAAGWAGVMSLPLEIVQIDDGAIVLQSLGETLIEQQALQYWQFDDVSLDELQEIETTVQSASLKIIIEDDSQTTIFLDNSVIELFEYQRYSVKREYGEAMGIKFLRQIVRFPIKRLHVWKLNPIWDKPS